MVQRLPVLIFDFGNVVAHFDYRKACARLGLRQGMTGEAFLERVRELGFGSLVQRYERGAMSAEEFSRAVCGLVGLEMPHEEFASAWSDIFWANEPIGRLVEFLRGRRYTLLLGSNTNDLHAAQFRRQFAETLAHFDRLVLSYEIGHIKPSTEFYLSCARAGEADPGSCVFIDDLPENVEGARDAGLQAILYRSMDTLLADLRALGVEVPTADVLRPSTGPTGD